MRLNWKRKAERKRKTGWRDLSQLVIFKRVAPAPARVGKFGSPLRSPVTTLINTCRSERKAEDYQQVVSTADQPLAPSSSHLSSRFAIICHNYYYVFMT
jgi:hypothetical protein